MPKIILLGGSSEIGNSIANALLQSYPDKYRSILKISTTLQNDGAVKWDPVDLQGIQEGLKKLLIKRDDTAILALGILAEVWNSDSGLLELECLDNLYNVNLIVPMLALSHIVNEMRVQGGGQIILLSSAAAFPVLDANFIYSSAKHSLDSYARYLQRKTKGSKVKIIIVRSGFVATKLNLGRKPTPFSMSAEEVANLVVKNLNKRIIWTPAIFQSISYFLIRIKLLQYVANLLVRNSKN